MYAELGSTKKPVALSPREALNSAEALLTQLGYEIVHRTDTSLTAIRHKREGLLRTSLRNLSVETLPQPQGGVQIKLSGDDREGVEERRAEWSGWVESLPKIREEQRGQGGVREGTASSEPVENRAEEPRLEAREDPDMGRGPSGRGQEEGPIPHDSREREVYAEAAGDEETPEHLRELGGWATVPSWDRKSRIATGKQEEEPIPPPKRSSDASANESVGGQEEPYMPASDATASRVVEAESFRLVNSAGQLRGALTLENDKPHLFLADQDEEIKLMLVVGSDGLPSIGLVGRDGHLRVNLAIRSNGSPTLDLTDDRGELRLRMTLDDDELPSINFIDREGEGRATLKEDPEGRYLLGFLDARRATRATFHLDPDGSPSLVFRDADGEINFMLRAGTDGSNSLAMYDADRELRVALQVGENGVPSLGLTDENGNVQAVLQIGSAGGTSLVLLDRRGNVIWRAP